MRNALTQGRESQQLRYAVSDTSQSSQAMLSPSPEVFGNLDLGDLAAACM